MTTTAPDWSSPPFLETILMVGKLDPDDATKLRTMFLPPDLVEPLTARLGEMAPSKLYLELLDTEPFWKTFGAAGLISYHRTLEPAPPETVCCVHRANLSLWFGATAPMACVSRPSSVSIFVLLPLCGALGGAL